MRGSSPTDADLATQPERRTLDMQRPARLTRLRGIAAALAAALVVAGCSDGSGTNAERASSTAAASTTTAPDPVDALRLNELQYIGTHNSYHISPNTSAAAATPDEQAGEQASAVAGVPMLDYTHDPLPQQLATGTRAFELDVFADPDGNLFDHPMAPTLLGEGDPGLPASMSQPGFKVLHLPDIDFRSTCWTFVECLTEVHEFSDANPDHVPIFIQIELKDDTLPAPLDFTATLPIGATELDALDAEIRSVFDEEHLITPDTIRGDHPTLAEAIATDGWPTVGESRGKVVFFLDNGGSVHDTYLAGSPNLQGRAAFTSAADPGDPDRAIVKLNDPFETSEIADAIAEGLIVRTRADADLEQAPSNDVTMREAALTSGAQIVSTDFPATKVAASGYVVGFGTGLQVRCNAVVVTACPTTPVTG